MRVPRWLPLIAALLLAGAQWVHLSRDRLLLDGDEEGVVGMVEEQLGLISSQGLVRTWSTSLRQDWGEFPVFHPLLSATVLRIAGPRSVAHPLLRWPQVLWWLGTGPLIAAAAWASARVPGRDREQEAVRAWLVWLLMPLPLALSRHLLLEVPLMFWAAATWAAVQWGLRHERAGRRARGCWVLAGIAAGLGLLTKQTFLLVLAPGWLVFAHRSRRGAAWLGLLATLLAAGWYLPRLAAEWAYLWPSAGSNAEAAPLWKQLLFYPAVGLQLAPGPWLAVALVVSLWSLWRRRESGMPPLQTSGSSPSAWRSVVRRWVPWLLLFLPFLLLPKKYPRLMAPAWPVLAWGLGPLLRGLGRRAWVGLLAVGLALQLVWTFAPGRVGPSYLGIADFDERCVQQWFNPVTSDTLLFDPLIERLPRAARVAVYAEPSVPCSYQTSLGWRAALFRRARLAERGWEEVAPNEAEWLIGVGPCSGPDCAGAALWARFEEEGRLPLSVEVWRR